MTDPKSENQPKKDKASKKSPKKEDKKTTSPQQQNKVKPVKESHSTDPETKWNTQSFIGLIVVSFISLATKFYGLGTPNEVVFDEVHFGKFASSYIKREYFFDVHPPLGKLLFAAVGYLFGYDGSFSFENIGMSYQGSRVPYVDMRSVSALCGTLVVSLVYAMLIEMRFSLPVAVLGAFMIAFDNALVTQSRFILLDAQLIFFIVATCFCWVKFRSYTNKPFSLQWWFWLAGTGFCLGLTLGVKLVGFFVVAAIGVCTILDLWDVMDLKKTSKEITVAFHWLARIVCLIGIPIIVFLVPYWVHFKVANHSGSGDHYMSTEFQATLIGNKINEARSPVYYGSIITLKSNLDGTYLHSHNHTYPLKHHDGKISSKGQQVTGFTEQNDGNDWMILPALASPPIDYKSNPKIPVKNGDLVRLYHLDTEKFLMTQDVASPLTITNQEVSAVAAFNKTHEKYPNILWRVDIVKGGNILESKLTVFRLHHNLTRTNLLNYQEKLPDWAFNHKEINSGRVDDKRTWWTIDEVLADDTNDTNTTNGTTIGNKTEAVPPVPATEVKMTFWQKLFELLSVSVEVNEKLVDSSPYLTTPSQWPFLTRGISLWTSKDKTGRIYLLGNPFTWLISILTLPIFISLVLIDQICKLRGRTFLSEEEKKFMYPKGLFFLLCYALHYLPFFMMGRVLYFHHYLPCYLFNALIFVTWYQTAAIRIKALNNPAVIGVICSLIIATFFRFSALIYGSSHNEDYFESLKWFSSWHF